MTCDNPNKDSQVFDPKNLFWSFRVWLVPGVYSTAFWNIIDLSQTFFLLYPSMNQIAKASVKQHVMSHKVNKKKELYSCQQEKKTQPKTHNAATSWIVTGRTLRPSLKSKSMHHRNQRSSDDWSSRKYASWHTSENLVTQGGFPANTTSISLDRLIPSSRCK